MNILNLGFGVQSTYLYLASCLGELPRFDCAIAADTGWEPRAVYAHLQWLREEIAPKYGIPIHVVSAGNLRADMIGWESARRNKSQEARMPLFVLGPTGANGMLNRQCTARYKIYPIERFIKTELLGLAVRAHFPKERVVRQSFGISADEWQRCAYPLRKCNVKTVIGTDLLGQPVVETTEKILPSRWKSNVYPLCNREYFCDQMSTPLGVKPMTRQMILPWFAEHGFPMPPRSACIGCPFHSDAEWVRLRDESPEEFEDACQFDESIRGYEGSNNGGVEFEALRGQCFLHPERIPLRQVQFGKNDYPMFQCSDGVCGT